MNRVWVVLALLASVCYASGKVVTVQGREVRLLGDKLACSPRVEIHDLTVHDAVSTGGSQTLLTVVTGYAVCRLPHANHDVTMELTIRPENRGRAGEGRATVITVVLERPALRQRVPFRALGPCWYSVKENGKRDPHDVPVYDISITTAKHLPGSEKR